LVVFLSLVKGEYPLRALMLDTNTVERVYWTDSQRKTVMAVVPLAVGACQATISSVSVARTSSVPGLTLMSSIFNVGSLAMQAVVDSADAAGYRLPRPDPPDEDETFWKWTRLFAVVSIRDNLYRVFFLSSNFSATVDMPDAVIARLPLIADFTEPVQTVFRASFMERTSSMTVIGKPAKVGSISTELLQSSMAAAGVEVEIRQETAVPTLENVGIKPGAA